MRHHILVLALCLVLAMGLVFVAGAQTTGLPAGALPSTGPSAPSVSKPSSGAPVQDTAQAVSASPEARALLALSSPDYPVTPGDLYVLSFLKGAELASLTLVVDGEGRVNLGVFGALDGRGLVFPELKRRVEDLVARAYPGSSPLLTIRSTGVFRVLVTGEVPDSSLFPAWGLTRLSEVFAAVKTSYSSERDVEVTGPDGRARTYDLFRARRVGDFSQDPLLKPGDVVRLARAERRVNVSGEVLRPGTYHLLPGEGLRELLERYAGGLTDVADRTRIRFTRNNESAGGVGEADYLNLEEGKAYRIELRDLDAIAVGPRQAYLPAVFFEGAVGTGAPKSGEQADNPTVSNRVRYVFYPGERLSGAVLALRNSFSAVSDLPRAYLRRARDGAVLPVDLENYLHRFDFTEDPILEPNDVIVVPFRQYFVTVTGAVVQPGRYPYVPDRTYEYYLGLAGGRDEDKNNGRGYAVFDQGGRKRGLDLPIQPEDTIQVPSNSFLYIFQRVSPFVTTTVSVMTLLVSVIQLSR